MAHNKGMLDSSRFTKKQPFADWFLSWIPNFENPILVALPPEHRIHSVTVIFIISKDDQIGKNDRRLSLSFKSWLVLLFQSEWIQSRITNDYGRNKEPWWAWPLNFPWQKIHLGIFFVSSFSKRSGIKDLPSRGARILWCGIRMLLKWRGFG